MMALWRTIRLTNRDDTEIVETRCFEFLQHLEKAGSREPFVGDDLERQAA